jgi:hypothetical protein
MEKKIVNSTNNEADMPKLGLNTQLEKQTFIVDANT